MASNYEGLPLDMNDTETAITVEAALEWIAQNTTIVLDPESELPANVKLFILKYSDLTARTGVASESLGGMSQSFSTSGGAGVLLADIATQLFGSAYKGRNRFVAAQSRWK